MASLYVAVQYEPKVGCSARKESGISRSRGEEKKKGNHKGHEETQSSQSQIWRALRASSSPPQKPRQNEMNFVSFVSLGVLCGFPFSLRDSTRLGMVQFLLSASHLGGPNDVQTCSPRCRPFGMRVSRFLGDASGG